MQLTFTMLIGATLLSSVIATTTAQITFIERIEPIPVVEEVVSSKSSSADSKGLELSTLQGMEHPEVWDKTRIQALIAQTAEEYKVSRETMEYIVSCESQYRPAVQSGHYQNGVREDSWGLVQINLPSWGGKITKEQALDPEYSIRFLADALSKQKGHLWTCYRVMQGK